jgi:hypothetical protein
MGKKVNKSTSRRRWSCLRQNRDGKCGLTHRPSQMAVHRPDPIGLEAADNVRTTGRATVKSARFIDGGLPGTGKR